MQPSAYRRLILTTVAHQAMVLSFRLRRGRSAMTSSWLTRLRWCAICMSFWRPFGSACFYDTDDIRIPGGCTVLSSDIVESQDSSLELVNAG